MATLRKRRNVYYVDFTYEGKRHVKSTKTSGLTDAKRIRDDIQGRIARGTFGLSEAQKKSILLKDFFERYFEFARSSKRANTIANERCYARKFLAFVGNKNLRHIDLSMLDSYKVSMLKNGYSPTTFNIERRFLHYAFNTALRWNFIELNPVSRLTKQKVNVNRNYFTQEEKEKLFSVIDTDIADPKKLGSVSYNTLYRRFVEFQLNTGLRKREALELTARGVNFDEQVIYVENTKTKVMRVVPLNERAFEIARQIEPDFFKYLKYGTVSHKFQEILIRAGLRGFKLHSLRHTFATDLHSAGVSIAVIQAVLGHSDIRTTMVYAKTEIDTMRAAVKKLGDKK